MVEVEEILTGGDLMVVEVVEMAAEAQSGCYVVTIRTLSAGIATRKAIEGRNARKRTVMVEEWLIVDEA